jgi:hypothetical protein
MVLYLLPAFGMTVSTHYCGGKLADVSLFGSKPKMNCACSVPNAHNQVLVKRKCCEQFVYSLKLENQQLKQSTISFKSVDPVIPEETQFYFNAVQRAALVTTKEVLSYSPDLPPGRYKAPIYIQNDSFLL